MRINRSRKDDNSEQKRSLQSVLSAIKDWADNLLDAPEVEPIMTYEAAIKYFVNERPPSPDVKKGVLLRQARLKGHFLAWLFLNEENQPICGDDGEPYGRQLIVKKLDKELQEAFGNEDLIIVE